MSITIKEIAALAGVSIGTVDRALHNRGRVNADVAMRIKQIARDHGYEASRVGRALALTKNPVKIGIVVHLTKTEFMQQVIAGINDVKTELESMGVEVLVREIPSLDAAKQVAALDELVKLGAQGIAISPADDTALRNKINEITTMKKIPVVTFNTDMAGTGRMCFVGINNKRSGQTAAGLMGMLAGESGKVAIITGHLTNQANSGRVEGFLEELHTSFPNIVVTGVQVCFDDDAIAEQTTAQCVDAFADLSGIFVAAGGQAGVCRALEKSGAARKINVVAYDLIPATINGLQNGTIDFIIDQNAYIQGHQPANILFEYLFDKIKVNQEMQYTDILIKTKHNL